MTASLNLKELERKAFRSTYQDGLWDIYQGGLIASFTAFSSGFDDANDLTTLQRFILFLVGAGLSYFIFWAGKKFVTLPRMGQVKFGPVRQRRKRILAIVIGGIVGIQTIIVAFTIAYWQIPALRSWTGSSNMSLSGETLLVATLGALFVGPSLSLLAYFNDNPRGYYIAVVMAACVFCLIWFSNPYFVLAGGALIIMPGIYYFIRFLIQHPLPPVKMVND
jgi:hypothetical protein